MMCYFGVFFLVSTPVLAFLLPKQLDNNTEAQAERSSFGSRTEGLEEPLLESRVRPANDISPWRLFL